MIAWAMYSVAIVALIGALVWRDDSAEAQAKRAREAADNEW